MAAFQKRNNYQDQGEQQQDQGGQREQRSSVPVLQLTPDAVEKLSEMTRKDGFLHLDPTEIEMILDLCPECLFADFRRFIYRASGLQLNPLHNEIHMEYRFSKGKAKSTFVVHIDGFRKMADRTEKRAGFRQSPGKDERGEFVETFIWRKDCPEPFVSRVYFHEFMQSGEYSLYKSKPYHMVAKCGEAFAYKQAFPVSGLTSEDEVEAWPRDQGPQLVQQQPQTGYAIGEKEPEKKEPEKKEPTPTDRGPQPMQPFQPEQTTATPSPTPAPTQPEQPAPQPVQTATAAPADPPQLAIAERLKALGVAKKEISDWVRYYWPDSAQPGAAKLTPDQYVEAFSKAEEWILANSLEQFRKGIAESKAAGAAPTQQATTPAAESGDVFASAPVVEAMKQIGAKWPMWGVELARVAALWCAGHVLPATALEAFLVAAGITPTTAPTRIEAFLAITRYMAMSSGNLVMNYSAKSGDPLSMLESDLDKIVGEKIRFATNIPDERVIAAFTQLSNEKLKGK